MSTVAGRDGLALPDGTRLLHIGPHKTGTTTVQSALHENRAELTRQGVHYAGRMKHSMTAAMTAASDNVLPTQGGEAGRNRWADLVTEVHDTSSRLTVLSSEFYCEAPAERIRAILAALGADRTHVVVTLRPVARIMGSQWQQYMQNQMTIAYTDWLDAVLNHPERGVTPSFWNRHRHDELVQRWADAAGPQNVTVLVVDDSDKTFLTHTFEDLLGIERGTLVPADSGANRSLTWAEVELMRTFNHAWREHGGQAADYTRLVRFGAARHLQQRRPAPDEPRLLTPQWAIDRALELGAGMATAIAGSGVRVVGDLAVLSDPALAPAAGENRAPRITPELGARLLAGLARSIDELPAHAPAKDRILGPVEAGARRFHDSERQAGARTLAGASGRALLGELRSRVRRRARGARRALGRGV